jgi:DNA polymerase III epsilon subunit-like protein
MQYLSLDIETTGLNSSTCDILEVGVYMENTNIQFPRELLPCFHKYIYKENYRGEPFALQMNCHILQKIIELRKRWMNNERNLEITTPEGLLSDFGSFLDKYNLRGTKLVVAGKNVAGFDIPFLNNTIPDWGKCFKFCHRVIDPGMLYFNPYTDDVPPDLKECKKRAGLPEVVSHQALDDAWDVIQLVRAKFPSK